MALSRPNLALIGFLRRDPPTKEKKSRKKVWFKLLNWRVSYQSFTRERGRLVRLERGSVPYTHSGIHLARAAKAEENRGEEASDE